MNQGTINGHRELAYNAWQTVAKLLEYVRIAYAEGRVTQADLDHAEAEEHRAYKAYEIWSDRSLP